MATSKLPASWSNKNKIEWLERGAYEALSRALNRAVADTGVNFSIWSAGRSKAEQERLFKANYAPAGRGRKFKSDRAYAGRIWARKSGGVSVASPDLGSNHEDGRAVDIHPAAIQEWFKTNGRLYGWSWDEGRRVGENWHFRYVPSLDQMKHEGLLDHAAVQRVVGASVDGKIGTGTVEKIKAWQKAHGLTADGKVGVGTKKAMGLSGKDDAAPAPVVPVGPVGGASVPAPRTVDLVIEEAGPAKNAYADRTDPRTGKVRKIEHVTIHWWGRPSGQSFEAIRDYLIDNPRDVSAHYVVSGDRVARILPEDRGAWGNGNRTANLEGIVIECDPNKVAETLPTIAALLADIFKRNGVLPVYPHNHWTDTECPGDYEPHIPALVEAATGGAPITVTTPAPVSPSGVGLPTGKELLVKLADVPDFPLLRTPGNLCYYGGDDKQTAVSGKMPNSLVPGEVTGTGSKSGAQGLKTWQARMNERGYSLTVDGRYGDDTENAAKNLQRLAGLAADGKIGPSTFYAAWLLPVVS